jgi:hypothetical protein
VGVRLSLDPHTGITLDVHLGGAMWVRAGWYPAHAWCHTRPLTQDPAPTEHRCWGKYLSGRVLSYGLA